MADVGTYIGALRKRVTIQSEVSTSDGAGGYTLSWGTVATVWAQITPRSGQEVYVDDRLESRVTHEILVRIQSGITTDMRILYGSRTFNIRAVMNIDERNHMLRLLVEEGTAI